MDYKNLKAVISDHKMTPYLLHYTSEQNWEKIQHEGLIPQKNKYEEDLVIFFGREKDEVYANKYECPIVIAVPFDIKRYNLKERTANAEYISNKHIFPDEFLGVFNFAQYTDKVQRIRAYVDWLEKMERKVKKISSKNH
ncbi:MAG: hypothetical protein ACTSQG_12015 [Promethearchaeota archaeon]